MVKYDDSILLNNIRPKAFFFQMQFNVVDIPYDIITSIKLEKGLLSSTIRFKAPALMSSTRLGMMDSIVDGEDNDQGRHN